MKRVILRTIVLCAAVAAAVSVSAQSWKEDPRYGNTPEEREENVKILNFFNDAWDAKNYDDANKYLAHLLEKAPKATQNLYVRGATLYKNKINRAKTEEEKKVYIDSLMLIYDMRMEYFGSHSSKGAPYIARAKAMDYAAVNPQDRDGIRKFYREAVAINGAALPTDVAVKYFNELVTDYGSDLIEAEVILNEYENLAPLFEAPGAEGDKETFDALFASSGAANCDNLEALFGPKLNADPKNADLVSKAYALMSKAGCSSDLYLLVAEKYYEQNPSSNVAINLASQFEARNDFSKALQYLNEALATETDPIEKSVLYVRVAASELGAKHASASAAAARQAITLNPDNGFAYYFLALAYADGTSACQGFAAQTVYWLVYDYLMDARRLMSNPAQIDNIDSMLSSYRKSFPSEEDCFFNGCTAGSSFNVKCGWISGTTTVKSR